MTVYMALIRNKHTFQPFFKYHHYGNELGNDSLYRSSVTFEVKNMKHYLGLGLDNTKYVSHRFFNSLLKGMK